MSSRRLLALPLLAGLVAAGCEQNSAEWFPHMKKQPAIQAFEELSDLDGDLLVPDQGPGPLMLPEGSIPVSGSDPQIGRMDIAAAEAFANPTDPADFKSLQRGEELYGVYCLVCHGATGLGNGPVSATGGGPFGGVYPLVGLVTVRSDGYIWNVIRLGSGGTPGLRMPSYQRIPSEDRWHLVNYVRYLDRKGGRP